MLAPRMGCRHFLFLLGTDHYNHPLTFELRHLLYFSEVLEVVCESQQQHLALFLEQDGTAFEEHICLHLGTFLKEALCMLELEVIVVVVGLGSESYFLHHHFGSLGFDFLGFLLLLVKIFLVVEYLTNRWIGLCGNLHQIEFEVDGHAAGVLNGIYTGGEVVAHQTHL